MQHEPQHKLGWYFDFITFESKHTHGPRLPVLNDSVRNNQSACSQYNVNTRTYPTSSCIGYLASLNKTLFSKGEKTFKCFLETTNYNYLLVVIIAYCWHFVKVFRCSY